MFAAGADIGHLRQRRRDQALAAINRQVFDRIARLPLPTVAAVDGPALGGGAELAYACDVRIASTRAMFGNPEPGLGILAAAGAAYRLRDLIGRSAAKAVLLAGHVLDADAALRLGLVMEVTAPDELIGRAHAVLDRICAQSALALRITKLVTDAGGPHPTSRPQCSRRRRRQCPRAASSRLIRARCRSRLSRALGSPERFIGMHFFNPVPVSVLVEIVTGAATDTATTERAVAWTRMLGKSEVIVRDSPGFATSRLGVLLGLEAIRMLEEGVADAASIDRAMELGYRHPMGPLRSTDLVGLDVRLNIARHLARTLGPRFEPPDLLRDKVARGELGRKTGHGFYRWDG